MILYPSPPAGDIFACENLTEDMKIESEEVLDDDSLMLTTDI